jgi:hypothetical protein
MCRFRPMRYLPPPLHYRLQPICHDASKPSEPPGVVHVLTVPVLGRMPETGRTDPLGRLLSPRTRSSERVGVYFLECGQQTGQCDWLSPVHSQCSLPARRGLGKSSCDSIRLIMRRGTP